MSVDNAEVIDFVARSPKTNEVLLVMVEARDWKTTPDALAQLHTKFSNYAQYVMSGALVHQYPDMAKIPITIRLDHLCPMIDPVAGVLRQWAGRLSGIPIGVCSHRMYWSRLVNLIRKLRPGSQERDIIRWSPEPGSIVALLTRAQFTEELVLALRRIMPRGEVQILDELQVKVKAPGGAESEGCLDNAYTHYMATPEQKEAIIQKYAASFHETTEGLNAPIDQSSIVPILKDGAWVTEIDRNMKQRSKEKMLTAIHEPYNEELTIVYAQDTPRNVQYLTSDNLAALKLDLKQLGLLACANLKRLLPEPDIRADNGLYRIMAGGNYDACLLLLDDFWDIAKIEVDGELIAAVPARDFLMVTGSGDASQVARLKQTAQSVASKAPYRLSPNLFVRRHGHFVPYEQPK
jgi:uncharacterized protein YtpQ (UPF0354 family)